MNPIDLGLLVILAVALIILLWQLNTHLKAIRRHLNTISGQRADLSPVRYMADEIIALRTMLNVGLGALVKATTRSVDKMESVAAELRKGNERG